MKKKTTKPTKTQKASASDMEGYARQWQLDAYELELEKAFEAGKVKPAAGQAALKKQAQLAAQQFMKKTARLNIRISDYDLSRLKQRAAYEGLPYQTLAASIIHKVVSSPLA